MAKKYAPIEKVEKKHKHLKKVWATMRHHHANVINSSVKKILKDEDGLIDYSRLKKPKTQKAMADDMTDGYINKLSPKLTKMFGRKISAENLKKLSEEDKDHILYGFYNITKGTLRKLIAEHKDGFTEDFYNTKVVEEAVMKPIILRMHPNIYSHLDEKHIDDILDYTKSKDWVNKDAITLEKAVDHLLLTKFGDNVDKVTRKRIENKEKRGEIDKVNYLIREEEEKKKRKKKKKKK